MRATRCPACAEGERCQDCRARLAAVQAARRARRIAEGAPARQVWGHNSGTSRPPGWDRYNAIRADR